MLSQPRFNISTYYISVSTSQILGPSQSPAPARPEHHSTGLDNSPDITNQSTVTPIILHKQGKLGIRYQRSIEWRRLPRRAGSAVQKVGVKHLICSTWYSVHRSVSSKRGARLTLDSVVTDYSFSLLLNYNFHSSLFLTILRITMKFTGIILALAASALAIEPQRRDTATATATSTEDPSGFNIGQISSALYIPILKFPPSYPMPILTPPLPSFQCKPPNEHNSNRQLRQHLPTPEIAHPRNPLRRPRNSPLGIDKRPIPQLPRQRIQRRQYPSLVQQSPRGREELHVRGEIADFRRCVDGYDGVGL